jgi:hypothetical protein
VSHAAGGVLFKDTCGIGNVPPAQRPGGKWRSRHRARRARHAAGWRPPRPSSTLGRTPITIGRPPSKSTWSRSRGTADKPPEAGMLLACQCVAGAARWVPMTAATFVNGRMLYPSWRFREKIGPSAAAATLAARRSRRDHRPGSRSGLDMVSTGRGSSGKVHGVEGDAAVGRPLYSSGPRRRGGPRGVPARCHRHTCQPPRTRPRSEESHFRLRVTTVLGSPSQRISMRAALSRS